MWNPSAGDIAEILALKKANPTAERHIDELLKQLAVAARKVAFYEGIASPDTIAKATEAGFAGMTMLEKSVYVMKAAGSRPCALTKDFALVGAPTATESEAMAKRAPASPLPAPMGKVAMAGGFVDSDLLAMVKHAPRTLPAGHCGHNDRRA